LLSQRWSLYEKQVHNKFHSPAHRNDAVINILQTLTVRDVYRVDAPVTSLPEDMTFATLKRFLTRTGESFFPVVDDHFRLRGILSLPNLHAILFEDHLSDLLVVGELASPAVSVRLDESLYDALVKFLQSGYGRVPIVDDQGGLKGLLRLSELMAAYHREIVRSKLELNNL
ncbi:MAG: CBS domain-containing protein, partial [Desulforhabdus sp.]|nr:CBS domain-containing protein [Desulforhabdus sp.]